VSRTLPPRAEGRSALEGVVLVDFGQYLAGPFGPMIIGDLGADVIKVEPLTGDGMRFVNQPFIGCQRGKRDIALDLKNPKGVEVARKLVEKADIVHHNMTVGVANRLGIGYDDCKAVNPDVVYCNTYAYGLEGPLAHSGGLDPLFQATAGLEYESGPVREGNPPMYYRFGMTDTANAMLSVVGCLAALYHQRKTGEGQELWTSLLDGGQMLASDALLVDGETVPVPKLDKDQTGIGACYRLYETGDGWLQVACVTEPEWRALCTGLGVPELVDDARFADTTARGEHRTELEDILGARLKTKTALTWTHLLNEIGAPCEIPLDTKGGELAFFDADNERLGLVAEYEHPILGTMRQFGNLIDFSETPGRVHGPPPLVGEHTREILEWIGYAPDEMDALKADKVVYWPDPDPAADPAYIWTV
jgi:crotonobetainyl-CoA:carnitine CoA-transferase CaiB-like acyl-CoA transferase